MSLAERIIQNVKTLPESKQIEVLDFVEYLRLRTKKKRILSGLIFHFHQQCEGWKTKNLLIH